MMILLNRTETVISGAVNGKPFGVSYDPEKWQAMKALQEAANNAGTMDEIKEIIEKFTPLTEESYKELVEHKTPYLYVNKSTNQFFLKYQNKISSNPLPKVLVDKIVTSVEKSIEIDPLIKCWARYMREIPGRPKYTAKRAKLFADYILAPYKDNTVSAELQKKGLAPEVADERATTPQVAITMEGLLVCYKVSTEITKKWILDEDENKKLRSRYPLEIDDVTGETKQVKPEFVEERIFEPASQGQSGDAFYCDDKLGHIIKVGETHFLEKWEQVDCNDDHSCVKVLHVGGLRYIQGYQTTGTETHNVFVDPADIGAIVGLGTGNDGAMRVKRYFVFSSFAGPNKNIYHSSKYAALNDEEYAKIVEEAVLATEAKAAELKSILEEHRDLIPVPPKSVDAILTIES